MYIQSMETWPVSCIFLLVQLAIESGVGIAVLVLCFVDKKGTESNIVEKLGNGFSRAPFAAVVVCLLKEKIHFLGRFCCTTIMCAELDLILLSLCSNKQFTAPSISEDTKYLFSTFYKWKNASCYFLHLFLWISVWFRLAIVQLNIVFFRKSNSLLNLSLAQLDMCCVIAFIPEVMSLRMFFCWVAVVAFRTICLRFQVVVGYQILDCLDDIVVTIMA